MEERLIVTTGEHYLAFVLGDESVQKMVGLHDVSGRIVKCHHVTVAYEFEEKDVPILQTFIDSVQWVQVTGILKGDGITAFNVVMDNKGDRPLKGHFHLTHSFIEPLTSSDSNKFYTGEIPYVYEPSPHTLTGSFQLVPKGS